MSARGAMARELGRRLGAAAVSGGTDGEPLRVRPDHAEGIAAAFRWAHEQGVPVQPMGPEPLGGRVDADDSLLISTERLRPPLILQPEAGTVRIGAGTTGAELAWQLHREGRCPWPRPAPFHREALGPYLAGPGLAAEFVALSMWESPLMSIEAVLTDGRRIRAGVAPRSAAGPDYRAFFLGTGDRLGLITAAVWRTVERSVVLLFAASFPSSEGALATARAHCQAGWRPFSGWIGGGGDPDAWREPVADEGAILLLALRADGPRADLIRRQLERAAGDHGGRVLPSRAARYWYEQSFLHVCQGGTAGLEAAAPARVAGQLGTARIAVPWSGAAALWETLETVARKGPLKVVVSAEIPRPEGVILHVRLCRRGRSRIGLARALERIEVPLEVHGGVLAGLHDPGGRAVDLPRPPTTTNRLLDEVALRLGAEASAGSAPPREA